MAVCQQLILGLIEKSLQFDFIYFILQLFQQSMTAVELF